MLGTLLGAGVPLVPGLKWRAKQSESNPGGTPLPTSIERVKEAAN